MTLQVELGTASALSDSYSSLSEADAYLDSRGRVAWAQLDDDTKEQCLRRACDYMTQRYRLEWKGRRVSPLQALDWPRWDVQLPDLYGTINAYVPPTSIPTILKNAQIELAFLASTNDLDPPRETRTVSKQVGPIKVVYDMDSPDVKKFTFVDNMLGLYLGYGGPMMHRLARC